MTTDDAAASPTVGFVGLGNIGSAMAKRLLDWPGGLVVHDLRAEAVAPFVEAGAREAADLDELAAAATVISVVVLDDAQVRDVVGRLAAVAAPGTVVAIHSTIEVDTAPALAAAAAARDVHVLDAPVSGGAMGAAEGRLAVMVGGERAAYERVKPPFGTWAELILHVGPAGAGTATKLARNLLTFAGYAAAAESQRLAEAAGVDLQKLAAIVRHSDGITGGPSAIMVRDRTAALAANDPLRPIFEHTRGLGEKDLALALSLGATLGVDLPFTRLALDALAAGLGVPDEEK
ncbi:MAG TPA: NAD(P)-dependent oxidoreductase [Mycobacteriales bacterium]|nr:NAD(P)-dependent oxidoreductase [Mycobacteriales bacterium]